MDTSTRPRLLIPFLSALPWGKMKSPECEACPLFFSTYPKAGTRCQSLQTAQNQRVQTRKARHFLLHSISEGQTTLCSTTRLSMVSVTSATGSPWVGEKRSPELQVSETLSKVKWTGMEEDIQSPTSGLHIGTYTHAFGCAYTHTHAKQISI